MEISLSNNSQCFKNRPFLYLYFTILSHKYSREHKNKRFELFNGYN